MLCSPVDRACSTTSNWRLCWHFPTRPVVCMEHWWSLQFTHMCCPITACIFVEWKDPVVVPTVFWVLTDTQKQTWDMHWKIHGWNLFDLTRRDLWWERVERIIHVEPGKVLLQWQRRPRPTDSWQCWLLCSMNIVVVNSRPVCHSCQIDVWIWWKNTRFMCILGGGEFGIHTTHTKHSHKFDSSGRSF
jgi:hypothetical protein